MTITKLKNTLELVHAGQICDFNLAQTQVDDKPLFRMGNIARENMPQLKGFPREGSVAALLPKDKNGKVDVTVEFLNYLTHKGISVTRDIVSASDLKGSQSELVASKVAKHALKMLVNPDHKKLRMSYLVSRNNILLDGHHGWAAVRCLETLMSHEEFLSTFQIDCDIHPLIEHARCFTKVIGIQNKEGV